jgi:TolA-binding protein
MALSGKLSALGKTIAELEDEALGARKRPSTKERLTAIRRAGAQKRVLRRHLSVGGPFALAGILLGVLVVALFSRRASLNFVVGPAKDAGELGAWVSAPAQEPRSIAFSDGSRVRLTAGARARVVSTTEHGARVVLERGSARVDVVPNGGNDWRVIGGPFEVHVTGTSFDAEWEPEHEVLRVTMYEGHVEIRGGCLSHVRALSGGDSATISCATTNAANAVSVATPSPAAATATVPVHTRAPLTSAPGSRKGAAPEATNAPEPRAGSTPSWRALARPGSYKESLAAAESEGFGALCTTLSLEEMLELATTARLAGNLARANEAYLAVRARFPGSDGAAAAAFHLGQIAFDGARMYADARRWFTTYLSERPSGALAAEALGRSMEAEQRMGDLSAARATAIAYLQRYPTGAHVRLARSLLEP